MSAFYDRMIATAARLIAKYGQPVTLIQTTGASDCVGIEQAYKANEIDGTLVKQGDNRVILASRTAAGAALAEPKRHSHVVLADGVKWSLESVEAMRPAGQALVYILQLRR